MNDREMWPLLAAVVIVDATVVTLAFVFPIFCYVLVGVVSAALVVLRFYPK